MYVYTSSGFNSEYLAIQSTNASIIEQIVINNSNFISAGISSYAVSLSTFGYISSSVINTNVFISSQISSIYKNISSYDTVASTFSDSLRPFTGSTTYYQMLPIIANYSTSLYAKGAVVPTYISRSTTFYSITALSSMNVTISSFSTTQGPAIKKKLLGS
jgi:hypothetical protein